jgi:predicted enzyme related to lactoylglutathione lyase
MNTMTSPTFRLAGVELYFADLQGAQQFYGEILGLELADAQAGHHAKFTTAGGFVCLECRGAEDYPSADKAVVFFEVANLAQALERVGPNRVIKRGSDRRGTWAVLHDPEGHNVLLLESPPSPSDGER